MKGNVPAEQIGAKSEEHGRIFKELFHSPSFQVDVIDDVVGTQLCGSLKNIVAMAAGFSDGLGFFPLSLFSFAWLSLSLSPSLCSGPLTFSMVTRLGSNTKSAVIRIGFMEMRKFAQYYYEGVKDQTFFESCGLGDVLTTCYNGRNRRLSEMFVRTKKVFLPFSRFCFRDFCHLLCRAFMIWKKSS